MIKRITTCLPMIILPVLISGCVTQAEFDKYKQTAELTDKILLCESAVDAYQDLVGSDEPNPSRRDEPSGSRRDQACQDEYKDVTQGNANACATTMNECSDGSIYSNQECRVCEVICLNTATWPITGAPSCPPPF
ncbi:MAG: hypothetical protein ACR2QU_04635 [Gammaproteobacteria bacterium]